MSKKLLPVQLETPRLGRAKVAPTSGMWLSTPNQGGSMALLDRMGRHAQSVFGGPVSATGSPVYVSNPFRVLSFDQLRLLYQRTPDVRSSIDQITRRVATWDWGVAPDVDAKDPRYEDLQFLATEIERFMAAPNKDGDTWQEVLTKMVTDLLIYDAGVSELVAQPFNGQEVLEEIVPLRGADITPISDRFGRLLGYEQSMFRSGVGQPSSGAAIAPVQFTPDQILFLRLFPNTEGSEGLPILESLVNECVAILRASEHAMLAMDADEIPPGIVVLSGLARESAKEAVSDLKRMRGQDHKLRVITTKQTTGVGVNWVEMRHTPKDLSMIEVVEQIRKTIWRVFGVLPVEMGATDGMPRATAQVQLDVSNSHLLAPILELLEAKINARILPMLVGDPDLLPLLKFRFDRDRDLTQVEQQAQAETLTKYVQQGILTRNEARQTLGYKPYGEEGDIPTVEQGGAIMPLVEALRISQVGEEVLPREDTDGGVEEPESDSGTDSDDAPGESGGERQAAPRKGIRVRSLAEDLPSDWQPRGRFADVRTLNLLQLWESVAGYTRDVEPLYEEAERQILSIIQSEYRQEGLSEDELTRLRNRIGSSLDELVERWALATSLRYRDVAQIGRDAAVDWTAQEVVEDWAEKGRAYGDRAMQFLNRSDGLVGTLRTRVLALLSQVADVRGVGEPPDLRAAGAGVTPDIEAAASLAEVTAAAGAIFASEKHRIANWAGKVIELAYELMSGGLNEVVTPDEAAAVAGTPAEWFVEWVNVGDTNMCGTCLDLGGQGFVPLRNLPTVPGGATECGARCRCVLVTWTKGEIDAGDALLLGGGNTGTVL